MKITGEAVKKIEEDDRIDALRIKAFKTNADADRQAYFDAVSKWFQGRHDRSAALPHLQTDFKVKQLEWAELCYTEDYNFMQKAETSIGKYVATDNGWFLQGQSNWCNAGSLEEAKAAAQADFERRILGSLEGGVMDILTDIKSHLHPWLAALHIAKRAAVSCPPDIDDKAYWRHEIKALDAILGKLNALLGKPDGEEEK